MKRNFRDLLEAQWVRGNFVCVGLDSEYVKIPRHLQRVMDSGGRHFVETIFDFNKAIVEATKDIVCAYKPNIAFYEAYGIDGITALYQSVMYIHAIATDVPVILDAKRADIGNTNNGYVEMAFNFLAADAITVNPYLGGEALQPFLDYKDKGIIVLCRTSNPGAGEFQDLSVGISEEELDYIANRGGHSWNTDVEGGKYVSLYNHVAYQVSQKWNKNGNCALVVGATYPHELESIRRIVGNMPILIPGIGFQQKDVPLEKQVEQVVSAGQDNRRQGMIINSSRGIIFASDGPDFAEAARRETIKLRYLINQSRTDREEGE